MRCCKQLRDVGRGSDLQLAFRRLGPAPMPSSICMSTCRNVYARSAPRGDLRVAAAARPPPVLRRQIVPGHHRCSAMPNQDAASMQHPQSEQPTTQQCDPSLVLATADEEEQQAQQLLQELVDHPDQVEQQLMQAASQSADMCISTAYIDAIVEAVTHPDIGSVAHQAQQPGAQQQHKQQQQGAHPQQQEQQRGDGS